jgi:CheY-like chemotaxis protein
LRIDEKTEDGIMADLMKKILVVDDSKTALFIESTMLRGEPYQLVTAGDGREAVTKAVAERPDLILMDVMMPNMDGFEACKALRKLPETQGIPIIMVTTRGEEANMEAGFSSGCTDYVTKPINGAELLAKIRSYVGA